MRTSTPQAARSGPHPALIARHEPAAQVYAALLATYDAIGENWYSPPVKVGPNVRAREAGGYNMAKQDALRSVAKQIWAVWQQYETPNKQPGVYYERPLSTARDVVEAMTASIPA